MKKFCNKISRPQWRVTVPNLNTSLFRRSSSNPDGTSDCDSPVKELPNNAETQEIIAQMDTEVKRNSLRLSKQESDSDSDRESRYEDAVPMFEQKLEVPLATLEKDFDQNLYADVEYKTKSPEDTSKKFEYDIPKISFSFFDEKTLPPEDYDMLSTKPICATPKLKSEVKIVLAPPSRANSNSEFEIQDNGDCQTNEKNDNKDNAMAESCDDVSLSENKCVISAPTIVEIDTDQLNFDDITLVSWSKFGSDPSVEFRQEGEFDEDEGFYKVPTKPYKRLSRSLHDFNSLQENKTVKTRSNSETTRSQIIQHHVIIQEVDKENVPDDSSIKFEYCDTRSKLPLRMRRPTLLRKPQMRLKAPEKWSNFRTKVHRKRVEKSDDFIDGSELSDNFDSRTLLSVPREDEKSEFDFTSLKSAFRKSRMILEGQNGFDDLRRFVKQGGDFCKELSTILQERSEAELQYAKSLSKLSSKLTRACRDGVGGLNEAWKNVATDMESRADAHRQFSTALCEDIVRPLRQVTETQHKRRKAAESCTDKAARGLAEWRAAEAKSKKQSHQCARDNEKLQDALLDVRLARSTSLIQLAHMHNHKTLSDKESAKLEGKKRKAEDAVKKADIEYYTLCVRAERARLEWESAVLRGTKTFQSLEEERLNNLKSILTSYLNHSSEMCPKLLESTEKLRKPVTDSEPSKDMSAFINLKNSSQHVSEQLLPDFYCEHITLAMNRERRKQALIKLLHLIRQDLERERKSKNGLENLSRAMKQTPNFGAEDSQQNVSEKLYHMRSMLTYLEGARYKVQSALAELENRQRASHPLAAHITITRDKSGLQQSILKVPQWLREEFIEHDKNSQSEICVTDLTDWNDRGMADGNSNQHDSDFDEFSSQGSSVAEECHNVLGQCKALYAYTANLPDELNLQPGDILSVYRKQEDGWWYGECNGCVGIFPATYVDDI